MSAAIDVGRGARPLCAKCGRRPCARVRTRFDQADWCRACRMGAATQDYKRRTRPAAPPRPPCAKCTQRPAGRVIWRGPWRTPDEQVGWCSGCRLRARRAGRKRPQPLRAVARDLGGTAIVRELAAAVRAAGGPIVALRVLSWYATGKGPRP